MSKHPLSILPVKKHNKKPEFDLPEVFPSTAFSFLITAPTRSGKSVGIVNLLYNDSINFKKQFPPGNIFYISPTVQLDDTLKAVMKDDDIVKIDDFESLDNLDTVLSEIVKEQKADEKATELHPELAAWIDKNPWYKTNVGMRDFADALGVKLGQQGMTPDKVLKEVEKAVKDEFPHRFRNANRDKPSAVEGTQQRTTTSVKLTAQETDVMKRFIRAGVFKTEAEYIAEIKKQRDAERG